MQPGTIIDGYRVDRLLGEGGMAKVYQVWNAGLQRAEALKLLLPQLAFDRDVRERFLREAMTAARLQHPRIATIFSVSHPDAPQPFFTMELLLGGDIADLLAQRGRLGVHEALPLLEEVADALDYAHSQGVVHRDVKPANILLQPNSARMMHVKLADFEIARAQDTGRQRLTKTGMLLGTPEYMAPEQGGTGDPVSGLTDQYSLAIVAYEMLCGQPPFRQGPDGSAISVIMSHVNLPPPPPVSLNPSLPIAVSNALLRALSKRPQDRFRSCSEFVYALKGFSVSDASGAGSEKRTPTLVTRKERPAGSSALAIVAVALAGVIGLGLVAAGLMSHPPNDNQGGSNGSNPQPPSPHPVQVTNPIQAPRLIGLTEADAKDAVLAADKSLEFSVEDRKHSAWTPSGRVISQNPDPGTAIQPDSTVSVVVSTGPVIKQVRVVRASELYFSASSILIDRTGRHSPDLVMDGRDDTAWEEASPGDGNGEWLQFEFKDSREHTIHAIYIIDGYRDRTIDPWNANNRAGAVEVSLNGHPPYHATVDPKVRTLQDISPLLPTATSSIRLTFHNIKHGTRSNDLCISEVRIEVEE